MGRAFGKPQRSGHCMSALVCGLDVHKDSTYATILDCDGRMVSQEKMGERSSRISQLFRHARLEWRHRASYFPANRMPITAV
jgi:hypothetical protein